MEQLHYITTADNNSAAETSLIYSHYVAISIQAFCHNSILLKETILMQKAYTGLRTYMENKHQFISPTKDTCRMSPECMADLVV